MCVGHMLINVGSSFSFVFRFDYNQTLSMLYICYICIQGYPSAMVTPVIRWCPFIVLSVGVS